MLRHFRTFAAYNRWANRRLYTAAALLSPHDYYADRGAFFGSMSGTLNHLLVTDRIWLHRFTGEGEVAPTLDTTLYNGFAALDAARRAEDERIVAFLDGVDDDRLSGTISYRRMVSPVPIVQPLGEALAHFFNHQTHHRGQAHTLLTIAAGNDAAPSLDLIEFQREGAAAAS